MSPCHGNTFLSCTSVYGYTIACTFLMWTRSYIKCPTWYPLGSIVVLCTNLPYLWLTIASHSSTICHHIYCIIPCTCSYTACSYLLCTIVFSITMALLPYIYGHSCPPRLVSSSNTNSPLRLLFSYVATCIEITLSTLLHFTLPKL